MTNGRTPPPLPEFTFENGTTIRIRKVGPLSLLDLQRAFPPPKPPIQMTPLGPEENPAHPSYERSMRQYNEEFSQRMIELYIRHGVELDLTDSMLDEVKQYRAHMDAMGVPLPDDDKLIYVGRICLSSGEEIARFREAVQRRSQPTEEAVSEHRDSFQSPVQGAGSVENPPTESRNQLQPAAGVESGSAMGGVHVPAIPGA